ncbi:acyl-CoA desaturase [Fimbriiglobus ruber]|nr:acyl-CoA desaturase [Fimbriiglobus ruber]
MVIPFVGLVAAVALMWGWGFDWLNLALLVGMYSITAVGITTGFHRLFTHRSFETHPIVRNLLAVMGSMAVEGPILNWVAMHRKHHQHSDEPEDPHSPHHSGDGIVGAIRGFFHAHIGWSYEGDEPDMRRYVKDLTQSRAIRVINSLFVLWVAIGMLIPTVIGGVVTESWSGALLGLLWGGLVRIFFVHHVTWSVNSACHIWGSRPYESGDLSRNNLLFGILAFGEGWHNNHHAFPTSARHGLRWWQLDLAYMVIWSLKRVGLAWDVKLPSPNALARAERKDR